MVNWPWARTITALIRWLADEGVGWNAGEASVKDKRVRVGYSEWRIKNQEPWESTSWWGVRIEKTGNLEELRAT